jgi:hypothetical protein
VKAREWWQRGAASNDPFDGLSNYWRGFNSLYAGRGQERDLISDLLRAKLDEKFASDLLQAHAEDVKILLAQPVIDLRGNGKDTARYMREFDQTRNSLDKLVALFMVIYQVRCNFEHGQKSPSRDRDALLCRASCPIVAAVVDHVA